MRLSDIRRENDLTQKEAALLLGIPYRTYVRYEENPKYEQSYKYNMIVNDLTNKLHVDEEHGVLSLEKIKEKLIPILQKNGIETCYLFGSYAKGTARDNSDIDLLVDTKLTGLKFFQLIEEIRSALHKKIDLLSLDDLSPDNPISLEILKTGVKLL